jgi:aminoglycoside phosphotransferase (APT) family kinase protein
LASLLFFFFFFFFFSLLFLPPRLISIVQFKGGQSNPTFRLISGDGKSFVLRKKPAGKLLPKAHQVDREFRILKCLEKTAVPVPRVYTLCSDNSVIGEMFYLCEFLDGRILRDFSSISDMEERDEMTKEMARVLAALHSVDYQKVGLKDFGSEGNYYRRQLKVWSQQWRKVSEGES